MKKGFIVGLVLLIGIVFFISFNTASPKVTAQTRCEIQYDKTVSPNTVDAGGIVTATLTLKAIGDCSATNSPVDVALVIDRSGSMREKDKRGNGQSRIENAQSAAIDFVERMDLTNDQVAVVSFAGSGFTTLDSELGEGENSAINAINNLVPKGMTDIGGALQVASEELVSTRHKDGNAQVIILLSDGRHNESPSGELSAIARQIQDQGIRVITIAIGNADKIQLRSIASSAEDFYYAPTTDQLKAIYQSILGKSLRWAARDMTISDQLSDNVSLVVGSFAGSVNPSAVNNNSEIVWDVGNINTGDGTTLSYQVVMPDDAGTWPTSVETTGSFIDTDGNNASITFPTTNVTVKGQCGMPTVNTVDPAWACSNTTFNVNITGGGFYQTPQVTIDGESLSVQNATVDAITAQRSGGIDTGMHNVVISNACPINPVEFTLNGGFTVYPTPNNLIVSPEEGYGDIASTVTICNNSSSVGNSTSSLSDETTPTTPPPPVDSNGLAPDSVAFLQTLTGTIELLDQEMTINNCLQGVIPAGLEAENYPIKVESSCGTATGSYRVLSPDLNDDLWSNNIWVDPAVAFCKDDDVKLGALVHRRGGKSPVPVTVSFYYDDVSNATKIGDGIIPLLSPRTDRTYPNGVSTSEVVWDTSNLEVDRDYTVYAILDPNDVVPEDIEENNTISRTVRIKPVCNDDDDAVAPRVVSMVLNNDVETVYDADLGRNAIIPIEIEAEDLVQPGAEKSGVQTMIFVEYFFNDSVQQWIPIANTGWLTYSNAYSMTLSPLGGTRFIQGWVCDGKTNISRLPLQKQISYVSSCNEVVRDGSQTYRETLNQGDTINVEVALCDTSRGDPDLYIWPPDWEAGSDVTPWVSNQEGQAVEYLSFTAPKDGEYHVEVYGYHATKYNIQIEVEPAQTGVSSMNIPSTYKTGGISANKPLRAAPASIRDRSDYGPSMPIGSAPMVDAHGSSPAVLPVPFSTPEPTPDPIEVFTVYLPITQR